MKKKAMRKRITELEALCEHRQGDAEFWERQYHRSTKVYDLTVYGMPIEVYYEKLQRGGIPPSDDFKEITGDEPEGLIECGRWLGPNDLRGCE